MCVPVVRSGLEVLLVRCLVRDHCLDARHVTVCYRVFGCLSYSLPVICLLFVSFMVFCKFNFWLLCALLTFVFWTFV